MNITGIEWATFSANPLKYRDADGKTLWGCVKTSPGCANCYSEALAKRYGRGGPFTAPVLAGLTPFLDGYECHHMRTAKQIKGVAVSGSRCFIGDMTDIFGEWVSDDLLNQLFSTVLEVRTDVTWQILTKRAERMHRYLSWRWGEGRIQSRNIHIGVSVENQHFADERIPLLLQTPAAVRFISAEPLLGPVNLRKIASREDWHIDALDTPDQSCRLNWVIVGGESGHVARPFDVDWARSIIRQCKAAGTPVFVKQLGSRCMDGCHNHADWPAGTRAHVGATMEAPRWIQLSKKGGVPSEWAEDLRVREFPQW